MYTGYIMGTDNVQIEQLCKASSSNPVQFATASLMFSDLGYIEDVHWV